MKRLVLVVCLLVGVLLPGMANEEIGKRLQGRVRDAQGEPVEFATAILLRAGEQVSGAVTDSLGCFTLEAAPGQYELHVQYVGYEPIQQAVEMPQEGVLELRFATSQVALGEVVVRATQIERKGDRFVLSVLPQTGKDGSELLREAPGVWLSNNGLSINGASGTKVFVDEREVRLGGEALVRYLNALRADGIRSIEVIPIAGAEYEASTRGGVIRISLRHRQQNGVQGYVTMGTSLSPDVNAYTPSASIQARVGRWNLEASGNGDFIPKDKGVSDELRLYQQADRQFKAHQTGEEQRRGGTGRLAAMLEIDSMNTVGAELEYVRQHSEQDSENDSWLEKGTEGIRSLGQYAQGQDYHTLSATANYVHKLDQQGSVVKVIGNYLRKSSSGDNLQRVRYEQATATHATAYRSRVDADYDLVTADFSFRKQLSRQIGYQLGAKYTYTLMDDQSVYEGLNKQQQWETIARYGAVLRYHEHIAGAYGSFSGDWGAWALQAGLRLEYANTADQAGELQRDYFDLFPNVSVTRAFDPYKRYMLIGQYARNIERPAFSALNPNRIQRNEYSYVVGNPLLDPTYINRFSLTFVYAYRYTLSVGGTLHHNLVRENALVDSENPDASYITYLNQDRENHWFVALSLPFEPFPWLKLNANLTGVKQDIRAKAGDPFVAHYLGFANVTAPATLPQGFTFEARYSGQSRLHSGTAEIDPFHTLGLVVRKKLAKDRLLVTAQVDNLFDQQYSYVSHLPGYDILTDTRLGSVGRQFKCSLTWNFQSGKRVDKRKLDSANEDERNRLK